MKSITLALCGHIPTGFILGPVHSHQIWGSAGELVIDAILASRQRGQGVSTEPIRDLWQVERYIAEWLKRLGLVYDFRVEAGCPRKTAV